MQVFRAKKKPRRAQKPLSYHKFLMKITEFSHSRGRAFGLISNHEKSGAFLHVEKKTLNSFRARKSPVVLFV